MLKLFMFTFFVLFCLLSLLSTLRQQNESLCCHILWLKPKKPLTDLNALYQSPITRPQSRPKSASIATLRFIEKVKATQVEIVVPF